MSSQAPDTNPRLSEIAVREKRESRKEVLKSLSHRGKSLHKFTHEKMTAPLFPDDECIVCDECGKQCMFGNCPEHGPLEWIDDSDQPGGQQKTKARGSLPSFLYLMPSAVGHGQLGVFTRTRIEKRVIFGPFKGQKVPVDSCTVEEDSIQSIMYMWDVVKDGRVDHIVDGTDEQFSNWTRFVNCAQSDEDQNLVAVQFRGEIYYKTCKVIESGSELLVWYNDSCSISIDTSSIQEESRGWDFFCDACRLAFTGPTTLLRHKIVRCSETCGLTGNSCKQMDVAEPSVMDVSTSVEDITPVAEDSYVVIRLPFNLPPTVPEGDVNTLETVGAPDSSPYQTKEAERSSGNVSTNGDSCALLVDESYVVVNIPTVAEGGAAKPTKSQSRKRPLVHATKVKNRRSEINGDKRSSIKVSKSRASKAKRRSVVASSSSIGVRAASLAVKNRVSVTSSRKSKNSDKTLEEGGMKKKTVSGRGSNEAQGKTKKANKSGKTDSTKRRDGDQTSPAKKGKKARNAKSEKSVEATTDGDQAVAEPVTEEEEVASSSEELTAPDRQEKPAKRKPRKPALPKEKPVYKCDACEKTFKWKSALNYHVRCHASEKAFKCTICDKGLAQHSSLKRHLLTHSGEKPFKCDECGKGFVEAGKLNWHKRIVHCGETREKKHKCFVCEWSFSLRANLLSHMRTHTGEKPFPCPQCGKCFARGPDVVSHMRSHTGERPFTCSHCGKGFTMLSHKNRHEMIHTGEKPFKCNLCGKAFNQKVSVAAHEKVHAKRQSRLEQAEPERETCHNQNNPVDQPSC